MFSLSPRTFAGGCSCAYCCVELAPLECKQLSLFPVLIARCAYRVNKFMRFLIKDFLSQKHYIRCYHTTVVLFCIYNFLVLINRRDIQTVDYHSHLGWSWRQKNGHGHIYFRLINLIQLPEDPNTINYLCKPTDNVTYLIQTSFSTCKKHYTSHYTIRIRRQKRDNLPPQTQIFQTSLYQSAMFIRDHQIRQADV